jgi:hypothetical protein
VNQEGSFDPQPSRSSYPHTKVGQEVQSMESNDLQLITTENPSEVPEWVVPFDSAQLRSLLVTAIPPS